MNRKLPIALAVALALGCGARIATQAPDKQAPYVFPHQTHVDAEVACTNCHAEIPKATKLETGVRRHVALPPTPSKQKACQDCHDTDPQISIPTRTKPVRFTFSHADHLPKLNGDCRKCHQQLTEKGDAEAKRPPMAACTGCHKHQMDFDEARCRPCHVDLKHYQPTVAAIRHAGDWMRTHAALAKPTAESCGQCHDQTYCAKCHSPQTAAARPSIIFPERVERTFIHRGDYISRHMIDQAANPASCQHCHGPAFCNACHVQQKFSGAGANLPDSHRKPNWFTDAGGGIPEHGRAARRDIASCSGCHDQGPRTVCITCHNARQPGGGIGGNPHPASFLSKHKNDNRLKNPVCTACHSS